MKKDLKIYILCPANAATGGPEALHQLGRQLIDFNYNVFMYYYDYNSANDSSPTHPNYIKYNIPFSTEVDNSQNSTLIFPETTCLYLWEKKFNKTRKIVWWLSVTNFFISLDSIKNYYQKKSLYFIKKFYKNYPIPTLDKVKKAGVMHLAHSYFSVDFLAKNEMPTIGQVSDYMNDVFLEGQDNTAQKEDIIIYNPVKNDAYLEKIIAKTKDLKWVPIKNMTPNEVVSLMKKAKVYIDFGYHPGKERMPREACLMDCCLIVGKNGSAKFKEDMPILDEYHFEMEDSNIDAITVKIKDCFLNFQQNITNLAQYKNVLLHEKNKFSSDVKNVFENI